MSKLNPRIIKYKSDEYIAKGDYMQAVWESLKESGVLFRKYKHKDINVDNDRFKIYNE